MSSGITTYGRGLGDLFLAAVCIGFAICASGLLTVVVGFLCYCDENTVPRKQWFLFFPIICLVIFPGGLIQDTSQEELEWFHGLDYYGEMQVVACGGRYYERSWCATYPMSLCATTRGELIVKWNTTNSTTGMPLTCHSRVWQPSCDEDICLYGSDIKKEYRCGYANNYKTITQSMEQVRQCMQDRYQSTTFPNCTDYMDSIYGPIYIELYGNSKSCVATIPPEHGEVEYYERAYQVGTRMKQWGYVLIGMIVLGSLMECIYLKRPATRVVDLAASGDETTTTSPSLDWSADNQRRSARYATTPVNETQLEDDSLDTSNNIEIKELPSVV